MTFPFSNHDSKFVPTPTKCALECNKQDECRSFTFCGPDLCNLFKDDVHSTIQGSLILHDNLTCTYYGMEKSVKPTCMLQDLFIDIQNENASGHCSISKKRVDAQWGSWNSPRVLIDDESQWKTVVHREIVLEKAHGGKIPAGAATKVDSWLMFIRTELYFGKARSYCNSLGGLLFFNVNGSWSQLQFLHARLGAHWLGIYTEAGGSGWKSITGKIIPDQLLFWNEGVPRSLSHGRYVVNHVNGNGLNNIPSSSKRPFVCDMT